MNSLKKIKASYLLIALALLLVITGGVFALKSFDSKKLKGAAKKNVTYATGTYFRSGISYYFSSKSEFKCYNPGLSIITGPLPSNFTIDLHIKNNNKFPIQIEGIGNKVYIIKAKSSATFINIILGNNSYHSYWIKKQGSQDYLTLIDIRTYYSKNYVLLFNNYNMSDWINSTEYLNSENIYVKSYGTKTNRYEIHNISDHLYYFRWFTYKYDRVNKKEISYNELKGNCNSVGINGTLKKNPSLTLSKKYPKRLGYVKIYNNYKSCKKDKYGTNNKDVVYTWQTKVYKK